jgi:hypothetical protein
MDRDCHLPVKYMARTRVIGSEYMKNSCEKNGECMQKEY